ncbi:Non-motile and phage-resistance protein [Stieleria neptunia]|uniref:histidine kinase n=1 Tax=Stieleria neptunia TaxID=2527979 RepID=A0A518HTF3_9BACT|nr:hybrid sensor histidine kinase/response regulator [Stieleria neptunia]QDV44145.1 Non-motile and phage-resistance protein [Stieleria neptunia]
MVIAEQKTQLRILLIEDDCVDGESVTRSLNKAFPNCGVRRVRCLGDAITAVGASEFDVVLADLSLPDSRGLDSVVNMVQACPQNPLIVLTGHADDELSITAIAEGAQDYLVKGRISPELLQRSIRYAIQRHAMLRHNDQLLETLRERDLLLQNKNQKLEKACKTAQKFVDNVSHEFRTPLTVIMEYASLLADGIAGPVSDEQAKLLGVIDDRASDLNNMVDDMLDVSKLESGLLGASRSPCAVAEIIDHVLPAIRRKAIVREVRLDVEIDEDLPDVFCDPAKVGRVIVNLAINAIKFTRNPGRVCISARRHGENDISIAVSDNGVGIPADRQREIFQRFAQVKTEIRDSTKGFGLGLNIAQELVDLNFGKMDVESTEGVGSSFSFTLPVNCPVEVTRRFVSRLATAAEGPGMVSAIGIAIEDDANESVMLDVERFLVHLLRQNDLIFTLPNRQWLLLVSVPSIALDEFLTRLNKERLQINRNRPRGPLPELQVQVEGTWNVAERPRDIVQMVDQQLAEEKYCVT